MYKTIQPASIETLYFWSKKALLPSFLDKKITFNAIEVGLYIKGTSESDVKSKISALTNKAVESVINFGDDFYYKAFLVSTPVAENTLKKERKKLIMNFVSYAYKSEITEIANRIASKTINVPGNLETPAILEITPSIDIIDIAITGLSDTPITVKNLKASKKIIVNGEDCKVTVDGINKFGDTDLWEFPRLKPGSNTISFSKNNCDINIKYKPRFI